MDSREKYQELINNENETFSSICEMMLHSKVENGRQFLCAMNNIVDYYTDKNNTGTINFHIIYIPTCPEWARELLVRFLIHKEAFKNVQKFISIAREKTARSINLPEGLSSKHKKYKQLQADRGYFSKFLKLFGKMDQQNFLLNKSLFVVQDKDVITRKNDKNPWLEKLYTNDLISDDDDNVIVTSSLSAYDIEETIRKHRDNIPKIENIFIFHSQNRGKITQSYNIDQLDRLNQYGVGIKNCFVFYITEHPFRLYYAKENIKSNISSYLLNREIKRFDDFDGFITFTPDELDVMFQRKNKHLKAVLDSPDREIFTTEIDYYLDELPHNFRVKNALSLSFLQDTQNVFMKECAMDVGVMQETIVRPFFEYYKNLWINEFANKINQEISKYHDVAFVFPPEINYAYKRAIQRFFKNENNRITTTDFDHLKYGIDTDLVVLFTFRYTDYKYKSYPNSFDPLPLKAEQDGLTIINRLTHNRYYEWTKHYYDKDFNGLLFSEYRKNVLGWSNRNFQRPTIPDILDDIDEAEYDAREYMAEKCTVVFESGNKTKKLAADRVLYDNEGQYCISSLKELPSTEGIKLQFLDELVNKIKDNLINKTNDDLKSESIIRRNPEYALTEEEINSNIELWKFLLKRKVDVSGIEIVYNAIFPKEKEISIRGFERWLDFDYPMILPRSHKSQNNLLTYLGFALRSPYHRLILTKKLLKNKNTKLLNSQIESLLQSILPVTNIDEESYDELYDKHSDILTLLEIDTIDEIKVLIQLLEIKLRTVKTIAYDSDKA